MNIPKIGLLPMYLKLYDNIKNDKNSSNNRIEDFYNTIVCEFEKRNVEVITTPVCMLEGEFAMAIEKFEQYQVDAVVTLHLAYSPSLESIKALTGTKLPIVILDTTPTYEFGPSQNAEEIAYNHGIHGVQDMCNMLIRNGKIFQIKAGHWKESDVIDRLLGCLRAAIVANNMMNSRVGRIGSSFKGMGDFSVPREIMCSSIGIKIVQCTTEKIQSLLPNEEDEKVQLEIRKDMQMFTMEGVNPEVHIRTIRTCLAVREWIENEKLTAFTFNFLDIDKTSGLLTVPFMEASKAMARGLGYAGEGDVLTAALVGALVSVYPQTTFTEMFCPDWENDSILLSHMGEMNIGISSDKPVLKEFKLRYTDVENPMIAYARLREGKVVLVNLAPGPDNTFSLIVASGMMQDVACEDNMTGKIRGWFKPSMAISDFLEAYSKLGGTHHEALVYGDVLNEIVQFGKLMGWRVVEI